MFTFIKNLFKKEQSIIHQSGLIVTPPSPTDWFASGEVSGVPVDWSKYLPEGENQYVPFTFDSLSCTSFSALNVIEMMFKQIDLPIEHKIFLESNGYYKNVEINFSDKFIAITSGTTKNGNSFQNVGNAIRHNGLIPDSMLPFGNEKTWEDWHNKNQINSKMIDLGKEFVRYFDISYYFVYFSNDGVVNDDYRKSMENNIANAPLQIAIPFAATHATSMYKMDKNTFYIYDTYDPFLFKKNKDSKVHYVARYTITPRKDVDRTMRLGCRGMDVIRLQSSLNFILGIALKTDGIFGKGTEDAVKTYQKKYKLVVDGIVGKNTKKIIYSYMQQPTAIITRDPSKNNQTLGTIKCINGENVLYSKTMELAWKDNKPNISCIPKGSYAVKWSFSPSFKRYTYEVQEVKGRSGIRFHVANYAIKDLLGCIAIGKSFTDLNSDGTLDLAESTKGIKEFEEFFNKKPFTLIIE